MSRPIIALVLPALAGIGAAVVLTLPGTARAWDIHGLPGYSVQALSAGGDCVSYDVSGYGASARFVDCPSDPLQHEDFQQRLDKFINETCPCAQTTSATTTAPSGVTTTASATTTAVPPTTTAPTDTTAPPVTTVVAAPPAPPAVVTVTTVVQTTITDPSLTDRLTLLEQRQAADEARIAQLENPPVAGMAPLGEAKSEPPFTDLVVS